MARMIPAFMDDRTPPGERIIYNLLAAGPDEWVAIHSLDLAPWNRSLRTEIDFVIIIPDIGIVCVEVKSHDAISFENDQWIPHDIKRSPFKQAADGSHTFYRRLREMAPNLSNIPTVFLCIFPKANFDLSPVLSVQPWELIDGRCFRGFASGAELCSDISTRARKSIEADRRITPLTTSISPERVNTIVSICLPVQKFRPDRRDEIRHREAEAERILLEQQKPILRLAALNDRLIVSGGAGTGKSLIAMEVARRFAEQGHRVALVCFNQLVGDWLKRRIESHDSILPNLIVGRALKLLIDMTGVVIPEKATNEFWETTLPDKIEELLTDPDFKDVATIDYLVIDEAQDILSRSRIWQCLCLFLSGGIENGKFVLFGDFDCQVLSSKTTMTENLAIVDRLARPARWPLSENCRNYKIVGETALKLSGFDGSVYSGYMRNGGSIDNYNIHFYSDEKEQLEVLGKWLKDIKAKGYRPSEISILSFCSEEKSAAVKLCKSGFRLKPAWQESDLTGYATVQAFKGMENKIIILTDIELGNHDFERHLFYTGMTRATESVSVLCNNNSMVTLVDWFSGKGV